MKYLIALGFFASAIALVAPVKESDIPGSITTRREPEAMSLDKREFLITREEVFFPKNILFPQNVQIHSGHILLHFLMTAVENPSLGTVEHFCRQVNVFNNSFHTVWVTFWAISESQNPRLNLDHTPIIDRTLTISRHGVSAITGSLLQHVSGHNVMAVVKEVFQSGPSD